MSETVSKAALADRLGVKPSAVSNYIARGKLTAPALRPDGTVDVALAMRQLGGSLDLAKSAGKGPAASAIATRGRHVTAAASSEDLAAQRTLMRARAVQAAVQAEQARRKLNEEAGKYLLADQVASEWTKALRRLVVAIDGAVETLDELLGLDPDQATMLRQWWQAERARIAAEFAGGAEELPGLVEDIAA